MSGFSRTVAVAVTSSDACRRPTPTDYCLLSPDYCSSHSLPRRDPGTAAEGNARAKTGAMANVRATSGYVQTADGEPFIFSIIANNFEAPPDVINQTTDKIITRLVAEFRR